MLISEMMMITHNKMMMAEESWCTVQIVLDLLIIALLIAFFRRMLQRITEPEQTPEENTIKVKAVVKSDEPETPADNNNNDTERS